MSWSPYDDEPKIITTTKLRSNSNQGFVLGAILLAIAVFVIGSQMGYISPPDQNQSTDTVVINEDQPTVDPDKSDEANGVALKDCILLVIRDKREINENPKLSVTMLDDAFWFDAGKKVKQLEVVAPNDDQAKTFLERNDLKHPVVCLIDSNNKNVLWQIPLPEGGTGPIKEKLFP